MFAYVEALSVLAFPLLFEYSTHHNDDTVMLNACMHVRITFANELL